MASLILYIFISFHKCISFLLLTSAPHLGPTYAPEMRVPAAVTSENLLRTALLSASLHFTPKKPARQQRLDFGGWWAAPK